MSRLACVLVTILILQSQCLAEDGVPAGNCVKASCSNENCRCSNSASPMDDGDLDDWPQLISMTFDDAITDKFFTDYYVPILNRNNPDGELMGATFFVPHEYTDYQRVNDLYNSGFEIGVHSITKNPLQHYWKTASEEVLVEEFQGQREIISKFANIPIDQIIGVRTPQLQLSGNNSIKAYVTSGLLYDSSWPSLPTRRMFPYTLDYKSTEQCLLGAQCPNEAFPGFWILPINDFSGDGNRECNVLASCNVNGTAEEISDWLTKEVEAVRSTTKTPLTLMLSASWFNGTENSFDAFNKFLDNMGSHNDVFFVSQKQVLEWIKNPVKTSDFKTDSINDPANCDPNSCKQLKKGNDERNMNCCVDCPAVYPWLGNPDGNSE